MTKTGAARVGLERKRSNESRVGARKRGIPRYYDLPAAGAHAAHHLINEDATPGAGALPSFAPRFGREVDGAAG